MSKYKWRERTHKYPASYKTFRGICWRTNGGNGTHGVLFLEGNPDITEGSVMVDVDTTLEMMAGRKTDYGGLCVTSLHNPSLRWWQLLICRLFGIDDVRTYPPCIQHGSTIVNTGEIYLMKKTKRREQ